MYDAYVIWDGGSDELMDDFFNGGIGDLQWEGADLFFGARNQTTQCRSNV